MDFFDKVSRAGGIIIAKNKEKVQKLASQYGYYNITIIDYYDLADGSYYLGQTAFLFDPDDFITYVLDEKYGLWYGGK